MAIKTNVICFKKMDGIFQLYLKIKHMTQMSISENNQNLYEYDLISTSRPT
jgi:hypothetical protein